MSLLTTLFGLVCDGVKAVTALTSKSDLEKAIHKSKKAAESESNTIYEGSDIDEINRIFSE